MPLNAGSAAVVVVVVVVVVGGGGAEPADDADPGEDLAGQQGADPVELGQGAPGRGDRGRDVVASGNDAPVQAADLGDEVGGQPSQGALQRRLRADPAQ